MKRKLTMICCLVFFVANARGQSLDSLLIEGATNNPSLKAQYDLYQAALERVDQRQALPDPTLSFGYFISPVETRVGPQQFKLSIAQMFPWMGTNKQKANLASAEAKVQFEKFILKRNELYYKIKNTYADLYLNQKKSQFKKEEIEILESFEPTVKSKYESNLVSLTDLIRVQISIEDARSALSILKTEEKAILSSLNTLLNRNTNSPLNKISLQLDQSGPVEELDVVLAQNPGILMQKAKIEASEELIKLSDMTNKPSIGLGLDYAFVAKRDAINIPNNGQDILMPMLSLSLPIFGRKNKAIKNEALLIKSSAEHELTAAVNQLRNDWNQADYQKTQAQILEEQFKREIEQTQLMFNILIGEYTNRSTNFEEVLSTEKQLITLKFALEKVKVTKYKTVIDKEFIAGNDLNRN